MDIAKVFANGGSQAVRLPKSCRFSDDEILVNHIGDVVILYPKKDHWSSLAASLELFTEDFLSDNVEPLPLEEREPLP